MKRTNHLEGENEVMYRITELLIGKGKTQKELMGYIGLQASIYSEWKSGRSESYQKYIGKISKFLQVTPSYLLYGKDPEDTDETKQYIELKYCYKRLNQSQRELLLSLARELTKVDNSDQ